MPEIEPQKEDPPSQWKFVRQNKFFEVTPLAGYSFINAAKTWLEIFFWYSLLLAFTVITVINVTTTTKHYLNHPLKTMVEVRATGRNITMANFTISLNLSLFEFIRGDLTSFEATKYGMTSMKKEVAQKNLPTHIARKNKNDIKLIKKEAMDKQTPKIGLPYIPKLSQQLSRFLGRFNIKVFFKKSHTLGQLWSKNSKDCDAQEEQNIVYQIKCSDCHKIYIGKTERKLCMKLKEHSEAILKQNESNAIYAHIRETGHQFGSFYTLNNGKRSHKFPDNAIEIRAKENRPSNLLAKEGILIDSNGNTMNLSKGLSHAAFTHFVR